MTGPVDSGDEQMYALIEACRATLRECTNDRVRVTAGILDDAGRIFTAVQVRSSNCSHCSICAEAIAIGMAVTAGSASLIACVAVARDGDTESVWSPCGSCRELLRDHAVRYAVIPDERGRARCVPATDLLPWP